MIAPGATFSFNDRVGERIARARLPAGAGDRRRQVRGGRRRRCLTGRDHGLQRRGKRGSRSAERNPARAYIERYQLGRDATVNYPNLDLKFVNDTGRWTCSAPAPVGTASTSASTAATRAAGSRASRASWVTALRARRRSETLRRSWARRRSSSTASRRAAVSVERIVYDRDGKVLRRETWSTSYRSEPTLVRVGTKPKPAPPPEKKLTTPEADKPATTTPDPRRHDAGGDAADASGDDYDSAALIAAKSHAGIRVGRIVRASTVACGPAVRDRSPSLLDQVLAEPRASDVHAPQMDASTSSNRAGAP